MQPDERLAVIDLGSNSFRLVVFQAGEGWWRRTDEIYEPVRIGEGLMASGRLGEEPMERALATLDVFAHFCRASGLGDEAVDAVATSAIRDAENAAEFLARARERFALPIRVLSREAGGPPRLPRGGQLDDARATAACSTSAAARCSSCRSRIALAARVGLLAARHGAHERALPAAERARQAPPAGGAARAHRRRAGQRRVARGLGERRTAGGWSGIGGTVRNLAAAAQRAAGLPTNGVQGMVIEREALDELIERLAALPAAERASVPGIKPARADLILAGAVVVRGRAARRRLRGDRGDRGGAARGRLLRAPARRDREPPLFEDVRRASVLNMAAQYRVDGPHTRTSRRSRSACSTSSPRSACTTGDPRERELLWAACMLHDIGMSIDYDDHHKHSRYLILNGGLPGFAPVETAIIAQAARYHRKGMPVPGPMAALFGEGDAERLDRCAALLRLAEDLERSRDQLVRGTDDRAATARRSQLRLIAEGDPAVPRWAAGRERELFARAFHRELSVAA